MEFKEVDTEGDHNVSQTSPVKNLFLYLGGIFFSIAIVVASVQFSLSLIIPNVSESNEKKVYSLLKNVTPFSREAAHKEKTKKAKEIFSRLVKNTKFENYDLDIVVLMSKEKNAFAHPGGTIYLFEGLVDACKKESELALVIAHEIGHYQNRDHLRGLGMAAFFIAMKVFTGISNSFLDSLFEGTLMQVNNNFSRDQEYSADSYGLSLVKSHYPKEEISFSILETISKESEFESYFSTHPFGKERAERLKKEF